MALEDVPRPERLALIRGYLEGIGGDLPPSLDDDQVTPSDLGKKLGEARQLVLSASVSEYPQDKAVYDALVDEIERRHGAGVAARLEDKSHPPGLVGWQQALQRA